MAHNIIIKLLFLLLPITGISQNFIFNQHSNSHYSLSDLSITAIDVEPPTGVIAQTIKSSTNEVYLTLYAKYINWGNVFINEEDYDEIKPLTVGTDIYNTYYRFMNYSPYYSIWSTDPLTAGAKLTINRSFYFEEELTVHLAIFADNFFDIYVNNTLIASTTRISQTDKFLKSIHIFEIIMSPGENTISITAISDGTVSDALGFILLNNSKDELFDNPISKSNWTVLWKSNDYIGTTLKTATCPSGYIYDAVLNRCYKDVPLTSLDTDDIINISPVINNSLPAPDSWRMYFGDGVSTVNFYLKDTYYHTYNTSGEYLIEYIISESNNYNKITKPIKIN